MLGDNMSVVLNFIVPSSVLKKKLSAIENHQTREAIAKTIMRFLKIKSGGNIKKVSIQSESSNENK
jgi:hypothetical protein